MTFSERCGWIPNQMEVPPSIRSDYRWIQGLSVTEMEIMHGAYRKDNFNCECTHYIVAVFNNENKPPFYSQVIAFNKRKLLLGCKNASLVSSIYSNRIRLAPR